MSAKRAARTQPVKGGARWQLTGSIVAGIQGYPEAELLPMPKITTRKDKAQTPTWPTVVLALKGLDSERIDGTGPPGLGPNHPLAVLQQQGWRVVQIVGLPSTPDGITGYVVLAAP